MIPAYHIRMDTVLGVLAGIAILGLVAVSIMWPFWRSGDLIDRWAAAHGYRVVDRQYCWFWQGPFFFTTSKGQTVYRVTVELPDGGHRRGYVRCGGWWFGLLSERVDVRWDDGNE